MKTKQEKCPNKGNSTAHTRKKREEGGKEKENKFKREWFGGVGSPQHHTVEQSLALSTADA